MGSQNSPNGGYEIKALFLTTFQVTGNEFFNSQLYNHLNSSGVVAHTASFKDPTVTIEFVCRYSCITFLSVDGYTEEVEAFQAFIQHVLIPAKDIKPELKIHNGPEMALWNSDKTYLRELKTAGFSVPRTGFFPVSQPIGEIKQAISAFTHDSLPVVLKPSVSVSSRHTRLIRNPTAYTREDEEFLASLKNIGPGRSMLMQEFLPDIRNGEYSLLLLNGKFKYAWLKTPAEGEFRSQAHFGGIYSLVLEPHVPKDALRVAAELHKWLANRFKCESVAYARVDGIVSADGKFMLIEVELIEPALGLLLEKPEHLGTSMICREIFGLS